MQATMKVLAFLLVVATPIASADPTVDPCQESGACPDACDQCGELCHGDDLHKETCDKCIKDNGCEKCKECEIARGAAPPDAAFVESDKESDESDKESDKSDKEYDPTSDPCQESGECPDKCDECGSVCHGDDLHKESCTQCITENGCEKCKECEIARGAAAPDAALIDDHDDQDDKEDPTVDPCQESGKCPDACDECGKVCHGDDIHKESCDTCIKEKGCEECKKCEIARGAAAPDADLIESDNAADPTKDPCQENGECPDKCDACGTLCHGDDLHKEGCQQCIKEKGCEKCMECEIARGAAQPE